MKSNYLITETFQITGRGLVIAIDDIIDLRSGKSIIVKITRPDNSVIEATAHQELMLRNKPAVSEKTAFLLAGLEKSQVPIGSYIEVGAYAL